MVGLVLFYGQWFLATTPLKDFKGDTAIHLNTLLSFTDTNYKSITPTKNSRKSKYITYLKYWVPQ